MSDHSKANLLWDEMAKHGWVDERGGAEYQRLVDSPEFAEFAWSLGELVQLANIVPPFYGDGLDQERRCTCPVGWGQVIAQDCPRHNPQPAHTISPIPPQPR